MFGSLKCQVAEGFLLVTKNPATTIGKVWNPQVSELSTKGPADPSKVWRSGEPNIYWFEDQVSEA